MEKNHDNSNSSLEYKLFKKTIYFMFIATIILLTNNVFYTVIYPLIALEIIALILVFIFYWLLLKGYNVRKLSVVLVLLLFALIDIGTLTGSGLRVGNATIYLLIVIIMNYLIPLKQKNIFGIIAFVNLVILVILEYKWQPNILFESNDDYMIDKGIMVFLGFGICYYLTAYMREKYEEERSLNLLQNQELLKKNQEIEIRITDQKNLMMIIAHDLKSPLNNIHGLSNMLKSSNTDEKQLELINLITSVADTGGNLISEIVDISNFEEGGYKLEIEPLMINEFIKKLISTYEGQLKEKNLEINLNTANGDFEVKTDAHLLERILDNLLSNAIKFSTKNKKIETSIKVNKENFQVSVKDQGPGFTAVDKTKLYRKFQKLSARPTGDESSTGLGLAIVKTLTELLDGHINLISNEGKGTKFVLEFPIEQKVTRR